MTLFVALVLGLIQGLTEFLPVSSSGHLVLAQLLLRLETPPVFFDIVVHVATVLAIVAFFRKNLVKFFRTYFWPIVVGSIPTALIGLGLSQVKNEMFSSPLLLVVGFLLTTLILFSSKYAPSRSGGLTLTKAFWIGVAQGISILPSISRSGATIVTALWLGVAPQTAFSFSFLLSIPAILGAFALEFQDQALVVPSASVLTIGFVAALIAGFWSLRFLQSLLRQKKLHRFALYTLAITIVSLLVL